MLLVGLKPFGQRIAFIDHLAVSVLCGLDKAVFIIKKLYLVAVRQHFVKIFKALFVSAFDILARDIVAAFFYAVCYPFKAFRA